MRVNIGSLRALLFFDPSFGFGVIDTWGEDWKREDIGVLFGLGPFNVGLEMVQDGNSIRVLDVLWALGRVAKAVPSLFEDRDPLDGACYESGNRMADHEAFIGHSWGRR